jgi:hypothetical protein
VDVRRAGAQSVPPHTLVVDAVRVHQGAAAAKAAQCLAASGRRLLRGGNELGVSIGAEAVARRMGVAREGRRLLAGAEVEAGAVVRGAQARVDVDVILALRMVLRLG